MRCRALPYLVVGAVVSVGVSSEVSLVASVYGVVIRNLLQSGSISDGGDDDNGSGGGDGTGGSGGESDLHLLRGSETISSTIATLIAGERVSGVRTLFLGVSIMSGSLRQARKKYKALVVLDWFGVGYLVDWRHLYCSKSKF
ncbi:hypothetical protein Tco_1250729 [Tanacetum coccineum]